MHTFAVTYLRVSLAVASGIDSSPENPTHLVEHIEQRREEGFLECKICEKYERNKVILDTVPFKIYFTLRAKTLPFRTQK